MNLDLVDLVVLGDCNPDLVLSGGELEPAFGQVERLVDDARLVIGGSGAITACAAVRLGLRTSLVSLVGDDVFGRFMSDALSERGVDVSGVTIDATKPTGVSVVLVRGDDRAILTAMGTIDSLSADQLDRESLESARHVHVSSYFLQRGLHAGLPDLLAAARAAGVTTSIDPNWDPREEWDGGLLDAISEVDVLLCNAEEAIRITREESAEDAVLALSRLGPLVVVKLGIDGALASSEGRLTRVAAPPVEVVDTVGAGDTFDAGFLAARLEGRSLYEALSVAVACGSLSTRAAGGTAAQPTRLEVGLA